MPLKFVVGPATNPPSRVTPVFSVTLMLSFSQNRSPPTPHGVGVVILTLNQLPPLLPFLAAAAAWVNIHHGYGNFLARALVAVMDRLPPSAAPRRRAPPQGRLCGRSPASSERRRGASLVAVPAGAPVSVARPRPRPKGTTAPGKPAPCGSRASPDPGRRPSTRRTVRPRRGPGAGGTRSPAVTSAPGRSGLRDIAQVTMRTPRAAPLHRKRGRPLHNPEPDIPGFAPQRSGPPRPAPALGTGRFRCYTAGHPRGFPALSLEARVLEGELNAITPKG